METTATQRIVMFFKEKNIRQSEVTKVVSASKQAVGHWYRLKHEIRPYHVQEILNAFPQLNINWVFHGIPPMELSKDEANNIQKLSAMAEENQSDYGQSREECIEQLARANKIIDNLLKQIDDMKKNKDIIKQ